MIDTSSIHISPQSSPSVAHGITNNRFYFGPSLDSNDGDDFFPTKKSAEEQFIQQETIILKNAEEHEVTKSKSLPACDKYYSKFIKSDSDYSIRTLEHSRSCFKVSVKDFCSCQIYF